MLWNVEIENVRQGVITIEADSHYQAMDIADSLLQDHDDLEPIDGWINVEGPHALWATLASPGETITVDDRYGPTDADGELIRVSEDAFWAGYEYACREHAYEMETKELDIEEIKEDEAVVEDEEVEYALD